MTALMRAARLGSAIDVGRLLASGLDVNATVHSRDGEALLAVVRWMRPVPASDIGYTVLHYAVQGGHHEIVRLLVAGGAEMDRRSPRAPSAFELAIAHSDLAMLALMLSSGVTPEARHLPLAVARANADTVTFLLDQDLDSDAPPAPAADSRAPLAMVAATRGEPAIMAALIAGEVDVNARDERGWTPLRWARSQARPANSQAGSRFRAIVDLLEAAGARDETGELAEALLDAVRRADPDAVRAALAAGADANALDDRGVPVLVLAAARAQANIVSLLVDAGADVNASPAHDTTPLVAAVVGGSVDAARTVLEAGANPNQADHLHRTPLAAAIEWTRAEITPCC